ESCRSSWREPMDSSTFRMATPPQRSRPAAWRSCGETRQPGMDANPSFADVPIERVRDFWDRAPCNIRHSNKTVGTREYFDEVEQRKYFVESHIPGFADFGSWAGRRVLEIGCGIG